jgi:hypothetical protein
LGGRHCHPDLRLRRFCAVHEPSSASSEYVARETALALSQRKPIVPILVAGEPFAQFNQLHYFNLLDPNRSGGALAERLRDLLGVKNPPSGALQRRRVERLALRVFQDILAPGPRTSFGIGFGEASAVHLTDSLVPLDELEWAEVFIVLRELLPLKDFGYDSAIAYGKRFPTIGSFADFLDNQLTWEEIRQL